MNAKLLSLFLLGIFALSPMAFSAGNEELSQTEQEKQTLFRETIAKSAAFIRQVNGNPNMTQEQKDAAIKDFLKKQDEEAAQKASANSAR